LDPEVNPAAGSGGGGPFLRAAGLVSAMTLVSRVLGVVREQVFAGLLGTGAQADAFQIGFRVPNLLRDLFAEGALSAAFVPTYARALKEHGRDGAHRMASRVFTLLGIVMAVLVVLGIAAAGPLVRWLAPGFESVAGKSELTVLLTRVMMPFLPLVSFAAVAMGMLNAEERFGLPAVSPAMFNAATILWGLLLWKLGFPPEQVALGWALGTLLGGAAQFVIQVPGLRALGFRFQPEWAPHDPGLRRIGALMTPATVGLAAVQINIFINSYFASYEPGAVAALSYAFRILYLPIGIFGVAVGTIATSGFARRAAEGDMAGMRTTLRQSLSMLGFLTIPATAGLLVLARPVVRLLYERGAFTPEATGLTAAALVFYAIGLFAYTGVKVLAPAFYALGTPRVPLVASAVAVATNVAVNLGLFPVLGFRAVALGTSLGSLLNAGVLLVAFERRIGGVGGSGLGRDLARMGAAALLMAPLVWLCAVALERTVGTRGLTAQIATGLLPVLAGIALYGGVARLLGIPEAAALWGLVRRRLPG
jgi:putative peptidoglycan lipid II flippase